MWRNQYGTSGTTSHLNLKFSVRDVDHVLQMARDGHGPAEIARRFTKGGTFCTRPEIEKICADAGVHFEFEVIA